ncbi:MAG: hypothetical protein QGI09_03310 [Dehalococcoidia bacterium]|jgi:hypothetical protein|nr:hypothetical protein [Dehalococcoidia bacterium]
MELTTILNELHTLNGDQLRSLNRAVCNQLTSIRDRDSAIKRRTLRAGDMVSWNGRNGYTEGTIVRVKRKKAICDVGTGRNWDVPLNMLTAI